MNMKAQQISHLIKTVIKLFLSFGLCLTACTQNGTPATAPIPPSATVTVTRLPLNITPTLTQRPEPTSTRTPEALSASNVGRLSLTNEEIISTSAFTSSSPSSFATPPAQNYRYAHFRSYARLTEGLIGILWVETFSPNLPVPKQVTLQAINLTTSTLLWELPYPYGHAETLAWSPDGSRIAVTVGHLEQVWILDSRSGKRLLSLQNKISEVADSLTWSPDGQYLAFGGVYLSNAYIIDSQTGREVLKIPGNRETFITAMAWSPNSEKLAIGFAHGEILLASPRQGRAEKLDKAPRTFQGPETVGRYADDHSLEPYISFLAGAKGILALSFAPDGKRLVYTESTRAEENFSLPFGTLGLWDLQENKNIFTSEPYAVYGYRPVWLNDQQTLAVFVQEIQKAGPQMKVVFWDLKTGQRLHELGISSSGILEFIALSLAPDGKTLDLTFSERKIVDTEPTDRQAAIIIQHYQTK